MSKLLTISIAAYNVESYIGQTLDSLCANEILDDIEVFIIDDGGTDNTLLIAREYEKRFPDTFHAIHKKNGGYGSTVNWSMEHATGKYFKLLDGDDWMDKQGLIRLVEFLRNCDADLVLSGRAEINDSGERSHTSNYWETLYGECFDNQTVRLEQLETPFVYGIWVATYRTEIIKNYPNVLPEHQLYTDRMFICYWLPWIRTVAFQHYDVYCYRFGHEGQSVSLENRKRHSAEAIEGFKILL
ncbi:MAG: glycosyltransferase, partial [Bacteroidales bacterium]|nr:glycosyltransferase [Bacteroidales bacterium]